MNESENRSELIEMVRKIIDAEGSEEEIHERIYRLKKMLPHPRVINLIYNPGDGRERTAEEIVDEALAYKPIQL